MTTDRGRLKQRTMGFIAVACLVGALHAAETSPKAGAVAAAPAPVRASEAAPVAAIGAIGSIPAFTATALDGSRLDFSKPRGRWQVVNFWATWCVPCIKEIPELARFDRERDDVDVVGLAFEDTDVAEIRAFLVKHPADYPIAHVDPYAPLAGFAVPRGLPTTYVIAPDGRIAERMVGPVDGKLLAASIARHSVDKAVTAGVVDDKDPDGAKSPSPP